MYKILTAVALSTTMALAPATAQADTSDKDKALAAFLIGGAAILALSQANKNKDKSSASKNSKPDVYRHTHGGSTHWHHKDEARHSSHRHDSDRDDRWKRNSKVLPQRCVRSTEIGRSDFYYVENRCLKRADYDRSLPRSCSVARGRDGQPSAYGVRCLKREGYRFDNTRFEARR